MLYRSKIEVRKFSPKYKIVTPSKPLQDKGLERTKIITKPYRAEVIKPLRIGNRPIEKNDENIPGTLKMHNIGDLRPWKELKPLTAPDRYTGSEYRKIHVIHWWYTDRTCQDLTEIEKFHFAMLNLSDFDNKFDEIYFSVAVSPSVLKGMKDSKDPDSMQDPDSPVSPSGSERDFIIKSIKELTGHGRAAVYVKFIENSSTLGEYESWKNIFSLIDPSDPAGPERDYRDSKCTVIKKIPVHNNTGHDIIESNITENPEAELVSIPPLFEGFEELKPMTWIHKNRKDGFKWDEYKNRNVISFYSHFKGAKYLQEPARVEDVKYWSYIMYKSLIYSEPAWKESLMNLKENRSRCAILQGGVGRRYETLLNYYQKTICPEMKMTDLHMAGTFYFYNTGLIKKYYNDNKLYPSLKGLEGQLTHVSEFCSCFLAGNDVSAAVPEANGLDKYHMFTRKNLLGFYNEYLTEADRWADSKMDSVIYTVGKSTDSFIYMKDNDPLREKFLIDESREGDNIDDRNSVYCELTGLYMLWKDRREWKGLDHYRRCMMKDGQPVSNFDIMLARNKGYRALLARYDMPFANGRTLEEANTRLMFPDIIRERLVPILDKRNGFGSWFMEWISRKTLREACFCNMMVAEREVADEYCSLLFPSLDEFWKECRDEIPPRLLGYTTETMFQAWLEWKGIPYDPSYTIVTTKYAKYRK